MSKGMFELRRRALENEFFVKRDAMLLAKLRTTFEKEHPRETLKQLTGIQDESVIDTLVSLHVDRDTLAAFALYPLVEIAWADGKVDEKEREAFLAAATKLGLAPGTPGHEALREFLKEMPREEARKAWFAWAGELKKALEGAELRTVRDALLSRARSVAEASGGLLGLTNPISREEQRVLDRIAQAFSD